MEDINVTARRKHREAVAGMTPTKVLPPLREKKPILRDGGNRSVSLIERRSRRRSRIAVR